STVLSFVLVPALVAGSANADTVYAIVSDVHDQNGWDLSGTITTDGTIGTITGVNITAFDITVSDGVTEYDVTNATFGIATGGGTLEASDSAITLSFAPALSYLDFHNGPQQLFWANSQPNGGTPLYFATDADSNLLWRASPPGGYG